ncbi:hypothetical protein J3P89_00545 [Pseudomonas sp. Z1-14]|uniref:hypothetical protein n=1 Tax=Pseudomonas sp. Z1-14 TaxID=2817409 RepID=UPI003DAA1AAA
MDGINGARTPYATTLKTTSSLLKPTDYKAGPGLTTEVQPSALKDNTDTAQLSPLAQMLSDAAVRAAERDASNDRTGLAYIAKRVTQDIYSPVFQRNKQVNDAEVPASDDPQRLEQARQATNHLNNKGANPFQDLSLEQLTLIVYDDSGDFTVNERRAAWSAAHDLESAWAKSVFYKSIGEQERNGYVSPQHFQDTLNHYKNLPPIMEAQVFGDYEADYNQMIKSAELAKARKISGSDDGMPPWQSLLELMLAQQQKDKPETPATDA